MSVLRRVKLIGTSSDNGGKKLKPAAEKIGLTLRYGMEWKINVI